MQCVNDNHIHVYVCVYKICKWLCACVHYMMACIFMCVVSKYEFIIIMIIFIIYIYIMLSIYIDR